jgi:phosphopantothenoylcysteine decarboxylase/phosphopantothenate--cysteine ligase
VGFAAESETLDAHAQQKMIKKNLDLLFANDISRTDAGFGSDHNELIVYNAAADPVTLEKDTKTELAQKLVAMVADKRRVYLTS